MIKAAVFAAFFISRWVLPAKELTPEALPSGVQS